MKPSGELWVLTRVLDTSDAIWNSHFTIVANAEKIRSMFALSTLPYGWQLLKGKKARRFLRDAMKEELRFRRDKRARAKAAGN